MSVDNVDVDMQHHEPEDAQTSHDANLFDEDDDESSAGNFMDALSQPPVSFPLMLCCPLSLPLMLSGFDIWFQLTRGPEKKCAHPDG
ncbi:hypothetical protein BDR05DRAFT_1006272 [Suillus weaverae]|nr:hypothetical protein BDR05DRAFT_1006272 [Suillus weaverae]